VLLAFGELVVVVVVGGYEQLILIPTEELPFTAMAKANRAINYKQNKYVYNYNKCLIKSLQIVKF
jgi:hypothetical protein